MAETLRQGLVANIEADLQLSTITPALLNNPATVDQWFRGMFNYFQMVTAMQENVAKMEPEKRKSFFETMETSLYDKIDDLHARFKNTSIADDIINFNNSVYTLFEDISEFEGPQSIIDKINVLHIQLKALAHLVQGAISEIEEGHAAQLEHIRKDVSLALSAHPPGDVIDCSLTGILQRKGVDEDVATVDELEGMKFQLGLHK